SVTVPSCAWFVVSARSTRTVREPPDASVSTRLTRPDSCGTPVDEAQESKSDTRGNGCWTPVAAFDTSTARPVVPGPCRGVVPVAPSRTRPAVVPAVTLKTAVPCRTSPEPVACQPAGRDSATCPAGACAVTVNDEPG